MKNIVFDHVVKAYDKNVIVKDLNMEIREGERLILLGPSGCGKSTTLRMIAGLERLSGGNLYMDGRLVNDVPCGERNVSMVFQNYALFPNMTVRDNIAYGVKIRKYPKQKIKEKCDYYMELSGLKEFEHRRIQELSGGQQQRVAIARALASEAKVLLADEPTGNLDEDTAREIIELIKKTAHELGKCVIVVTHSKQLAEEADVVLAINQGVLHEQECLKENLLEKL